MPRVISVALVLLALFLVLCIAEDAPVEVSYLGETMPPSEAAPFSPDVLPAYAVAGTFNPEVTEFFCNVPGARESKIYGLGLIGGVWTPINFPTSSGLEPHISPDGDRLFFTTTVGGIGTGFVSLRGDEGWGEPERLPSTINGASYFPMYFSSTLDGSLYWTELSTGAYLVKSPFVDGTYGQRQRVNVNANATGMCAHPFIAPDESYLIFDRESAAGSNLYITFRRENGSWTPAREIDEISTSGGYEMAASVSPDGGALFFVRDMQMYWIDASILERYRP